MLSRFALLSLLALGATAVVAVAQSAAPSPPAGTAQVAPEQPGATEEAAGTRQPGAMAACRKDAKQLCADVPRGKGSRAGRMDCLVANRDKVSAECAAAMASIEGGKAGDKRPAGRRAAGARPMAVCQTDLATHCAGAEPANGGRMKCLRANEAKLTPECKASIAQVRASAREVRQTIRTSCQADATALCTGVERKNGALRKCLIENTAKLSQPCSDAMAQAPTRKGRG